MTKLLFIVNDTAFFASHRLPIARRALHAGFQVHLAAKQVGGLREIAETGVVIHDLAINRAKISPISDLIYMFRLLWLVALLRPDIVHTVTLKPFLFGGIVARLLRVPSVVFAISGLGWSYSGNSVPQRIVRVVLRLGLRLAVSHPNCQVIFQNPEDRQQISNMLNLSDGNSILIPGSGVDLDLFKPPENEEDGRIVLFCSRLLREKGIEDFVEAARIVRNKGFDASFLVAGDLVEHHPAAIPASDLRRWEEEGVIRYLGFLSRPETIISQCQVFCLPTYYGEGVPKALIEAAAMGRAIVATDMPGCREVVSNGENGILVDPRTPGDLADAIVTLLVSPELRRRFGARSRVLSEQRFSVTDVTERTLALYADLISNSVRHKRARCRRRPGFVP